MSANSNNSAAAAAAAATTTAATADSNQAVQSLPVEVRCSYPSKLCNNHRAVKDNGDLHKLCDFHRKKANVNQQRMQQKRRLIRQEMLKRKKHIMETTQSPMNYYSTANKGPKERFMNAAQAVMDYNTVANMWEPEERLINAAQVYIDYNAVARMREKCNFTLEEVMMLEALLFDDDEEEEFCYSGGASAQVKGMVYQTNAIYAPGMSSGNMSL